MRTSASGLRDTSVELSDMRDGLLKNRWVFALVAWGIAVSLVGGIFFIWQYVRGQPFPWGLLRDAALMVAPLALVMAWRNKGGRE